jgi:hypothetical protein
MYIGKKAETSQAAQKWAQYFAIFHACLRNLNMALVVQLLL